MFIVGGYVFRCCVLGKFQYVFRVCKEGGMEREVGGKKVFSISCQYVQVFDVCDFRIFFGQRRGGLKLRFSFLKLVFFLLYEVGCFFGNCQAGFELGFSKILEQLLVYLVLCIGYQEFGGCQLLGFINIQFIECFQFRFLFFLGCFYSVVLVQGLLLQFFQRQTCSYFFYKVQDLYLLL